MTVVGQERVETLGINNVADALNQIPSFIPLVTPATQQAVGGNVGAQQLDLRGLGATRTLVLLDGERFVPSTAVGTVDINLIPSVLVQRTEVVTGGASAAYGSDAVAGVVNFILDKTIRGASRDPFRMATRSAAMTAKRTRRLPSAPRSREDARTSSPRSRWMTTQAWRIAIHATGAPVKCS